jgi:hypothetical protein
MTRNGEGNPLRVDATKTGSVTALELNAFEKAKAFENVKH